MRQDHTKEVTWKVNGTTVMVRTFSEYFANEQADWLKREYGVDATIQDRAGVKKPKKGAK